MLQERRARTRAGSDYRVPGSTLPLGAFRVAGWSGGDLRSCRDGVGEGLEEGDDLEFDVRVREPAVGVELLLSGGDG